MDLPEDYATSCFLSGLKPEIELAIRMFMPKNVARARALAKIEEANLFIQQKAKFSTKVSSNLLDPANNTHHVNNSSHHWRKNSHVRTSGHSGKKNIRPLLPTPSLPALPSTGRNNGLFG